MKIKSYFSKAILGIFLCLVIVLSACLGAFEITFISADNAKRTNLNDGTLVGGMNLYVQQASDVANCYSSMLWAFPNENASLEGDGLAIRISSRTGYYPISLWVCEAASDTNTAEVWLIKDNETYITVDTKGNVGSASALNGAGIYLNQGFDGTLYIPYSNLVISGAAGTDATKGEGVVSGNLNVFYLFFETCWSFASQIYISEIATYDLENDETVINHTILNFATMSDAQFKELNKDTASAPGSHVMYANAFYEYLGAKRVALSDVVNKDSFKITQIGDVRIQEDFNVPEGVTPDFYDAFATSYGLLPAGYQANVSLVDHPTNSNYQYGQLLRYEMEPGKDATQPWASVNIWSWTRAYVPNWENWSDVKGVTFYVKNLSDFDFTIDVQLNEYNAEWKLDDVATDLSWKRWYCSNASQGKIFMYDTNTGKEYVNSIKPFVTIPTGFEGWVRIPLSNYTIVPWYTTYGGDGSDMNFAENPMQGFNICVDITTNAGAVFLMDNLGCYTNETEVGMAFGTSQNTIAKNMNLGA